ncbi:MAG: hypothetical protein EP330_04350 [Deltaproteobacteria bacterium]|nr:MAG: hypothetical protein EP330_04350 [Deltaproteobacteria bacterium]
MNFVLLAGGVSAEDLATLHAALIDRFGPGEAFACEATTEEALRAQFQSGVDKTTLDSAGFLLPGTPNYTRLDGLGGREGSFLIWCDDGEGAAQATVKAPGSWSDELTEIVAELANGFVPPLPKVLWLDRAEGGDDESAVGAMLPGEGWLVYWSE